MRVTGVQTCALPISVKPKKSNAEIAVLSKQIVDGSSEMDTLTTEEFLFSATLTPSLEEKAAIYKAATKDGSWVAHNNLGAVYLEMAKAADEGDRDKFIQDALTQLEIADNKEDKAEIGINMASAYAMQGEYSKAYETLDGAAGMASNEQRGKINGMKGAVEIRMGDYEEAKASLNNAVEDNVVTFNSGLVNLLTGDYNSAETYFSTVSENTESAESYYLSAVTAARQKQASDVIDNLKMAIEKDSSYKDKALNDLEFVNFADAVAQAIR